MDQYARKECARCHVIQPANEMFQRSGTIVSGRSDSTSQKVGTPGHQYYSPVNTTTTHYRTTSYWLCWPCEQQRRKVVRSVILAIVTAFAVLFGLAAIASAFGDRPDRPLTIASSQGRPSAIVTNADVSEAGTTAPGAEQASHSGAATEDSADQATTDAEALLSQLPTMLNAEVQKALRKNETRLWHTNGMRGYVVLSGDSASSAVCRNVVITMITAQEQRQTAPQKWCHSSDQNEWYPT